MKIITVLGARPQFIKAATVSRAIKKFPDMQEVIIHTGQHYDANMSDVFFSEMDIPSPDYRLNIASKHHGEMTGRMLEQVERVLLDEKPDFVLVYGDTNSTLAGALAAAKLHIPIAHVEAGLRSFNRRMPEEINRILTDHMASLLFAPTTTAVSNLKNEGIDDGKIYQSGDVMYDAVLYYKQSAAEKSAIVNSLDLEPLNYALVTIHRAENTNDKSRLLEILTELEEISKRYKVVFPMHPRTRSLLPENFSPANLVITEPVGYFDMLALQMNSRLIITDSGGVQKEAFFNNKFCITVREETEWIELVQEGFNFLAETPRKISSLTDQLWSRPFTNTKFHPYGNGASASEIVDVLRKQMTSTK